MRSTSAPVRKSNVPSELKEYDRLGRERFRRRPEGWHFWDWREYRCHYAQAGDEGTPIVLVHGFGHVVLFSVNVHPAWWVILHLPRCRAHSWHWRYNMLPLAEEHRVFAPDLLGAALLAFCRLLVCWQDLEMNLPFRSGFGLSPKGIEQYSAELWGSQIAHFLENARSSFLSQSIMIAIISMKIPGLACRLLAPESR